MRVKPLPRDSAEKIIRREQAKLNPGLVFLICVLALTAQALLPLWFPLARRIDLPLLAVLYLALLRRNMMTGMLIGMAVGMAQDGLSHGPIGLFGLIKAILGYSAGSLGNYLEVGYPGARSVLAASFFVAHEMMYWVVDGALLGGAASLDPARMLILAAIHAGVALIAYHALDNWTRTS
jgi:rod shape-determining protein MreD